MRTNEKRTIGFALNARLPSVLSIEELWRLVDSSTTEQMLRTATDVLLIVWTES
jgi:hypothetical protein